MRMVLEGGELDTRSGGFSEAKCLREISVSFILVIKYKLLLFAEVDVEFLQGKSRHYQLS